ncbi:LysR substrate-binding domain-containing protein [Rhodobium gokarnense]|uniref:DNA-binding transcriptional LysR family regulator n=1 Tax=Rhodobium gokarnense TaxID=364296 RepID=A0ABT3H612_9HYPH|nr:LysR substrate-binding domain-containing protein [Rhodobium gokarnense]MCW2305828.1 DNA-binding transcriptional LysR family regulator [Rhodobium gokarnense]
MTARRMGLQHIETFRAVVMTGSMTRAAEELHTSQPQISRLIGQLEEIAGFSLFTRNGTRIATSAEGAKFFEEVEKAFVGLKTLEAAADDIRSFRAQNLRVAAMPRLAGGLLTRAVAALKTDYPDVMVSIHSGTASAVDTWVGSGICDVGLVMLYGAGGTGLDMVPVSTSQCVCVLPAGHRLADREAVGAADLAGERFIAFSSGGSLRRQVDAFFREEGVEPAIAVETDLGASACALVRAGLGVSIINPMAALEEAAGMDIVVRPVRPELTVTLGLIFPPYRQRTRLVDLFEDYSRATIGDALRGAFAAPGGRTR